MTGLGQLPSSSLAYYLLYGLTLVAHLALVAYLVVGAAIVGVRALVGERWPTVVVAEEVTRDWLPFALGTAITAGVAPLLFVQILYKESFYTANLLLFHRWMAIVPVLIVAFYSLYWLKSSKATAFPRLSTVVRWVPLVGFLFVGWAWAENHALMSERGDWVGLYQSGAHFYLHDSVLPRLLVFLGLSAAMAPFMLGLQLIGGHPRAVRRLAGLGLAGAIASAIGFLWYGGSPISGSGIAVTVGIVLTAVAWTAIAVRGPSRLALVGGLGAAVWTLAATVYARELLRLSSFDLEALGAHQARAASSSGLLVFAIFLAANALVIVGCVRLVRRGLAASPGS